MKNRIFLNTSIALGVFALTSIFPAPSNAQAPQTAKSEATPAAKVQRTYIKALQGTDGSLKAAQTAIRRFNPIRGTGPSIYLVAAVHIGEKSYYKQIQQFLDKQSVVLYEGVKPSRTWAQTRAVRPAAPRPAAGKRPIGIQQKLSNALNLQFQLEGIQYNRPHFYNSDLDWDTMNALATKAGPNTLKGLGDLKNSVAGGPNMSQIDRVMDKVLTLSATTPFLANMLRRLLVTVLCSPDKIKSLLGQSQEKSGVLESRKSLDAIIINERNKAVLADLNTLIKASKSTLPKPIQSIAVFYGAEHMKDIEQQLVSKMGYRTADAQWITAIKTAD